MADRLSPERRSALMAKVKSKNSRIELRVRRLLHRAGYRFRVHFKGLPGTPDIVFQKRQKVILVHGCFWHGHEGCTRATMPSSRGEFWSAKLSRNKERDARNHEHLALAGWQVMTVWECETADEAALAGRLIAFLGPTKTAALETR